MHLLALPKSTAEPGASLETELSLHTHLLAEIDAMLRYACSRGLALSPTALEALDLLPMSAGALAKADGALLQNLPMSRLALLHTELAAAVAPAMPNTLRLLQLQRRKRGWDRVLGPFQNVRLLMAASGLFTMTFVLLSASSYLNSTTLPQSFYSLSGTHQAISISFLLAAAGIGGTFNALYTAARYIANLTYDPMHDTSYWIRVGIGVFSGMLLAELMPLPALDPSHAELTAQQPYIILARPVLALVGGFSSGLVYRILDRLVNTVEAMVRAATPDSK